MRARILSDEDINSAVFSAIDPNIIEINDSDMHLYRKMYEDVLSFKFTNDKTSTAKYYIKHKKFPEEYEDTRQKYETYITNLKNKDETPTKYNSFEELIKKDEHIREFQDYLETFNVCIEYFKKENEGLADNIYGQYDILMKKTLNGVISYAIDNKVKINSFDDMKIIYFLSIEAGSLYRDDNFLMIGVKILSQIAATERKSFINDEMYGKILASIESGKWRDNYGKFGIYTIMKEHYKGKSEFQ